MKRILMAAIALIGFTATTFGQGRVVLGNGSPATRIWTNNAAGGWQPFLISGPGVGTNAPGAGPVRPGSGDYMFALFSANVGVNTALLTPWTDPNWTFTGAYATNTQVTTGGRIFGQQNFDGSVTVPGHAGGTSVNLLVIGWNTGAGGTTLASFINAWNAFDSRLYYGYSSIATKILGDGGALAATSLFGIAEGNVPGFVMSPVVPEPTAFALAGLGAAVMLIFRKRK